MVRKFQQHRLYKLSTSRAKQDPFRLIVYRRGKESSDSETLSALFYNRLNPFAFVVNSFYFLYKYSKVLVLSQGD